MPGFLQARAFESSRANFRPLALGAVLGFWGCAGGPLRKQEGKYPDGKPQYRLELDEEGRKHGEEIWWYRNESKKFEARYVRGRRHGPFRAWYPDGKDWYRGRDENGLAQDTLVYWHSNGALQTVAVFRDGLQISRQDYDPSGLPKGSPPGAAGRLTPPDQDSLRRAELRGEGIAEWSGRLRTSVESYWVLPKEMVKAQHRAVAKIRVDRAGKILGVSWQEKSASAAFNARAQGALKKIKRLPPFPETVPDAELEIQYEFVTPGAAPRRKLELKGGPAEE